MHTDMKEPEPPRRSVKERTLPKKAADVIELALLVVSGSAFVAIGTLIIAQVFARYILSAPPSWTEELTRYIFVWLSWLSAAVVFRQGQHVVIEAITSFLSETVRFWHDVLVRIICCGILLFLLKFGWEVTGFTRSSSAALGIPMNYVYASAPVASFIMLLFALLDGLDSLVRRRSLSC